MAHGSRRRSCFFLSFFIGLELILFGFGLGLDLMNDVYFTRTLQLINIIITDKKLGLVLPLA